MNVSIIIPVLNEAHHIALMLDALQGYRQQGAELIVVDGGSHDATCEIARPLSDKLIQTEKGRARQMNAGAKVARGELLLFLHADTHLPEQSYSKLLAAYQQNGVCWSRFNVRLSGRQFIFRVIEWFMNRRSCLTGIATGDQALAIRRDLYHQVNGFPDIPLMEDVAISKCLKKSVRPLCLNEYVETSSRRWEQNGVLRTMVLMWWLRLAYFMGMSPARLAEYYYPPTAQEEHG